MGVLQLEVFSDACMGHCRMHGNILHGTPEQLLHAYVYLCRLPPISKKPMGIEGQFLNRGFAFQAPAWSRCRLHEIMLRQVFRQQSDQKFLRILQDIRRGACPHRKASS